MPTVLLTGARGFTGRYLEPTLHHRGYRVERFDSCDSQSGDLTNPETVRRAVLQVRPDFVVHLAAVSFVAHGDAEDFYRVNLFGTLNLLQALEELSVPPKRVILASTATVYGTPGIDVLDEMVCPAPINHYGCSKLAMEHMARNWFDRLPILITRPFNYTGPGQAAHFLVPKIVMHFKERSPQIELGNLRVSRDYSDVEDVVAAYLALLECNAPPGVVNICSGRGIALLDIISTMEEISGHRIEITVNPEFVRRNEVPRLVGSPEKLRSLVSLPPARSFRETLQRMYES